MNFFKKIFLFFNLHLFMILLFAGILDSGSVARATAAAGGEAAGPDLAEVQITKLVGIWSSLSMKAVNCGNLVTAITNKLNPMVGKLVESNKTCKTSYTTAAYACLEGLSPNAPIIAGNIQQVTTMMGTALSLSAACESITKTMQTVNNTLALWSAACASTRGVCNLTCGSHVGDLQTLQGSIPEINAAAAETISWSPASTAACQAVQAETGALNVSLTTLLTPKKPTGSSEASKAAGGKADVFEMKSTIYPVDRVAACERYSQQIMGIGMTIVNNVVMKKASEQCKQKAEAGALDCNLAENEQNPTCICKNNPRNPACAKMLTNGAALAAGGSDVHTQKTAGSGAAPGGGASGFDGPSGSLDGSSIPGAPMGGGGSGLGGGAGGVGGGTADGGANQKRLNANIYNGFEGGGGGGGTRFSFANSNESDSDAATKLRQYMPNSKDGSAVGQSLFDTAQVTGKGKSNWEKIRQRYNDNRQNLINK